MSAVWFNGALHEGPLAIAAGDRGLTLGDGLYETMLVAGRIALWRNMHLARMEGSARELGLAFNRNSVDGAIDTILRQPFDGAQVLRVTLTRGPAARGLAGNGGNPSLVVSLNDLDVSEMFQPATLITSSIRRSPSSPAARMKTLSYIDNIAAAREAKSRGVDDALLLNTDGCAASSTIANIFLIEGKQLITPARGQGILTGVMRQALLALAHQQGFETRERPVKPAELLKADAVFLTNSLRFIRPIISLDGAQLARRDLTSLADALCETARLQSGRDPRLI